MIRALALILILLAGTASATTDAWPALYDVVGVAENDVLNIRSGPATQHDVIGTLPPDAEGIEVIRPSEDFEWALINTGEGSGWVSLTYVVPQPNQWYGQIPDIRQCFGTEPFWSLTIDPPRVTYSTPDGPAIEGLVSGLYSSHSRRDRFAFKGALHAPDADPLDILLSVRTTECSDGMSDQVYGIDLDMLISDPVADDGLFKPVLLSGCCSLQPHATSD